MDSDYQQEAPFAFQIEPVEGCSLACHFCGIQAIRENGADGPAARHGKNSGPFKFMEPATAERIALEIKRLGWNPRIEFAVHGEPSLHKDLSLLVGIFRAHLPFHYLLVTCNGSGFAGKPEKIRGLFDAGLNTLAVDLYRHAPFTPRVRETMDEFAASERGVIPYHYPAQKEGNPHQRHKGRKLVYVQDILEATSGTHHDLSNHTGDATYRSGSNEPRSLNNKPCAKPFRELTIRWDGNVSICCETWDGQFKVGNVIDMPLEAIWRHPRMDAARRIHMAEGRTFEPCKGCTSRSTRIGLLPDKLGKVTLPLPTEEDYRHIREALAGEPYTPRVKPKYDFR